MTEGSPTVRVAPLGREDLHAVERIHLAATGRERDPAWWARMEELLRAPPRRRVAFGAWDARGRLVGYVAGEVRVWEFGSPPAGWVFAVGVDPEARRQGVARRLLGRVLEAFRERDIRVVRTMVRRDEVPVLRFFRDAGFVAGSYTELECSLDAARDEEDVP